MRVRTLSSYFGDARTDWCSAAAAAWPNAGERDSLRTKCNSTPMGFLTLDPWTAVGKLQRGLPVNFSSDSKIVASGVVGATIGIVGEGANIITPVAQSNSPPVVTVSPPQVQPTNPMTDLPSWVPPSVQQRVKSAGANLPLIIGGLGLVGLVGLVLMRSKRRSAPTLAGYGRKRRKSSRRRR